MAHSLSAKKRIRQNLKRRLRNRRRMLALKRLVREFEAALSSGQLDRARELLPGLYKKIDQIAAKGTLHKNTAARKKAKLALRLNKALAAAQKGQAQAAKSS